MNPYELQRYISLYNSNPYFFDDDFVDEIEKASKELDLPFQRNIGAEEQKQDNLLNQFASGVSSGFTTLGWADEPTSEAGQIVHSMGHLIGFAPAIIGGPLGILGKGAFKLGAKGVGTAFGSAARMVGKTKSFPFFVAEGVNKRLYKGLAKAGLNVDDYVKAGSRTADVLMSAQNLGVASAVSSIWEGKNAWIDSYIYGGIAGGAFGTIGNFMNVGKMIGHKNPNVRSGAEEWLWQKVAQGVAGGLFQGGMATMHDAPTSVQIYETLLGGFFGYTHPNAKIKAARKHISEFYKEDGQFKGKEREMTTVAEFETLPSESKVYVQSHFNKHIGERFQRYGETLNLFPDADPSVPSVAMENMVRSQLFVNAKLEVKRKELRKERTELNAEEETLAKVRTMNEIDLEIKEGKQAGEVFDKVNGKQGPLTSESEIIYNKLTKEQIEAIKKGDINVLYEVIRGNEDRTVDLKEYRDLINMDKPVEEQLEVDIPFRMNEMAMEIQNAAIKKGKTAPEVEDIFKNLAETYNRAKKDNMKFEDFILEIEKTLPDYVASIKAVDNLRSFYNRMQVEEMYPSLHFDRLNGVTDLRTTHDIMGKRIADNRTPPPDEVYFKTKAVEGKEGFNVFKADFKVKEIKTTKSGDKIFDLYGTRFDPETNSWTRVMKQSDWWNMTKHLHDKYNQYARMPNKDKGTERVFPYHPETNLNKWEETIKKLKVIDKDARKHIMEDWKFWVKQNFKNFGAEKKETQKEAWDIYRKSVISNVLYEPYAQFKDAPSKVKRETLAASKGIPLRADDFTDISPDGTLGFVIVNDVPTGKHKTNTRGIPHEKFYVTKDGKTREKGQPYESQIDGWVTIPEKLFERITQTEGMSEGTSRLKPTVWAYIDGQIFAIKAGIHPSHVEYTKATGQQNVGIATLSANKVRPHGTNVYFGEAQKLKGNKAQYVFKDKNGDRVQTKDLKPVKIKLEDLRIDYGVREDAHALDSQTVKKQFHVLLNNLQIPEKGFNSLMNEVFLPGIEGKAEFNDVVRRLGKRENVPIPENFKIGEIGDAEFVSIINDPYHPLFKSLVKHMVGKTRNKEFADSFGEEANLLELRDYTTRLQRWAKYSNYDPLITMIEPEMYQAMVLRYRKVNFMYPEWESSAASWGAGVDPISIIKNGAIKDGTFKLGHSMREMRAKEGDTGKYTTLGKLYDKYVKALKDRNLERAYALEEDMDVAIMRVPSPDVSGTRMLRFDGFIKPSGKGKDHGAYLHPKDHFYLDGMDVDGDKVFMYQGLPKPFRDGIRANTNNNAFKIDGKWTTWANKAEELDPVFGTTKTPDFIKSKASQYFPYALRKAGISSYDGKRGMGAVVNAKTMLNFMTADIVKKGGKVKLDLKKDGKKYGTVYLETSEEQLNSKNGYRRYSVEASSRTADSSNYWEMMDALSMRDVLLKSAFSKIIAKNNKGKKIDFNYKDIINTEYNDLYDVNNKLFGFNYRTGRQYNIVEVQNSMKAARSTEERMNSLLWLSNRMSQNNIELTYVRGNKQWRNLVDKYNDAWKDPNVRAFIARMEFKIKPQYFDKEGKPFPPDLEAKLFMNDALDLYSAIKQAPLGEKIYNAMIEKGKSNKEALDLIVELGTMANEAKINWRNARAGNKLEFLSSKYTLDEVETSMRGAKRFISQMAKDNGVSRSLLLDYYHTYMLGTLYTQKYSSKKSKQYYRDALMEEQARKSPNLARIEYLKDELENWSKTYNKTSFNQFPFETTEVPERLKKDFIEGFTKTWNVIRDDKPLARKVKKDAEKIYPESIEPGEGITKTQKDTETKIVLERFFDPIFKGKDLNQLKDAKIPKDIPEVLNMLKEDFKSLPPEYVTRIEEMYAMYTHEGNVVAKRVSDMTWENIREFQRYVRTARIASAKEPRVKKAYYYLFPERLGEKQLKYDLSQVYKFELPYNYANEKVGFVDIKVPFSTYGYMSKSFDQIYQIENSLKNQEQEYIQRTYTWRDQILGLDNGTADFAKMHSAAISKKISEVESTGNKEYIKNLYEKEWKSVYNEYKDKTFKITEGGKRVEKTGEEVMDWIVQKHDQFFKEMYQKYVHSGIEWDRIDVEHKYGKVDALVEFDRYGRMNLEKLQKRILDPVAFGNKPYVEELIEKSSLSVDLLNRMQYEIITEELVKVGGFKPKSQKAKQYREKRRKQKDKDGNWLPSAYNSIGEVKDFYWPQMMHRSTRKSEREIKEWMNVEMAKVREESGRYYDDMVNGDVKNQADYKLKKHWLTDTKVKADIKDISSGTPSVKKETFIDRMVMKQEVDFELFLGARVSEDGGASRFAVNWHLADKKDPKVLEHIAFQSRPGSGRARGENPMPGFSLDFEVTEAYSNQWVSSFHRNLTSLVSHNAIERFKAKNTRLKSEDMKDWENFMKMYARDVMGHPSVFSKDIIGLNKYQEADAKRYMAAIEKDPTPSKEQLDIYYRYKELLRRNKRLNKVRKTAYFKLSDENITKYMEWVATKLGGKANPKIPLTGSLPKSPEARKEVFTRFTKNAGAYEGKWSLISLLSHPKTAIGNLLGGNINTISNNGIRHFAKTKDKAFLYSIFKGGKLKDGTKITPENVDVWLNRFSEESGALESFIVNEAQLERGFRGTKVKGFLKEFIDELKADYSMPNKSVYDIAKKHGIGKAIVDAGAWFMRKSERMLRRDSFLSHYLNNYEILKDIIPNLKYDNPYLLRMATEGVKATQFLYHASARPAFSRTAAGKVLTRFMPFAWNSIRFRRMAYQKANIYGFDMNTQTGKRFQRLLMFDAFAFALANIYTSSIFDSALPPPMSYMQDTADWLFGDEKQRERAFFNQWPHPALAPLSTVTGPSLRLILGPTKAIINNDWEPFLNYQLWTWAPFGRLARSMYRTSEVPEMWLEEMTGIPLHRMAQLRKKAKKEHEEELELLNAA
jgi:hypothetical protein